MNERISKIISIVILAALASAGIFSVQSASAWWSENGNTAENFFEAGELKFKLEGDTNSTTQTLQPGNRSQKDIKISDTGDASIKYSVKTEITDESELCKNLNLTVDLESRREIYHGNIQDLATSSIALDETADWSFNIHLPSDAGNNLQGQTCSFDINYSGRQSSLPEGQGFTHEDTVSWTINTDNFAEGEVAINEVMWMGSTKSYADEWIELKNTTDEPIDIKGWTIQNAQDANASTTIDENAQIPGNGYFLVANYTNTHENSALEVQPNYTDTSIDLHNEYTKNGRLILKDQNGNEIDSTPETSNTDWPAGENEDIKRSMERDGSNNWHNCSTSSTDISDHWQGDLENQNHGTPGHKNSSSN